MVRLGIMDLFGGTGWFGGLSCRMIYTEVGTTGWVSYIDRVIAKGHNLKPLNRFEMWLLAPVIIVERERRRACFRRACLETLEEDPEADWDLV